MDRFLSDLSPQEHALTRTAKSCNHGHIARESRLQPSRRRRCPPASYHPLPWPAPNVVQIGLASGPCRPGL